MSKNALLIGLAGAAMLTAFAADAQTKRGNISGTEATTTEWMPTFGAPPTQTGRSVRVVVPPPTPPQPPVAKLVIGPTPEGGGPGGAGGAGGAGGGGAGGGGR